MHSHAHVYVLACACIKESARSRDTRTTTSSESSLQQIRMRAHASTNLCFACVRVCTHISRNPQAICKIQKRRVYHFLLIKPAANLMNVLAHEWTQACVCRRARVRVCLTICKIPITRVDHFFSMTDDTMLPVPGRNTFKSRHKAAQAFETEGTF